MRHNAITGHFGIRAAACVVTVLMMLVPCQSVPARKAKTDPKREAAVSEEKERTAIAEKEDAAAQEEGNSAKTGRGASAAENGTEGVPKKDYADEDFRPAQEEESAAWMFIKMIAVLGLFAGGFYYFYRFVTKRSGISLFGGEAIRVLSVVPIGQNKFLQIVDLAGRLLVLGVSDSGINLIAEITDRDQIDRIRILSNKTPPPDRKGGFQEQILRHLGRLMERVHKRRGGGAGESYADRSAEMEYLRSQRMRLRKMNGEDDAT